MLTSGRREAKRAQTVLSEVLECDLSKHRQGLDRPVRRAFTSWAPGARAEALDFNGPGARTRNLVLIEVVGDTSKQAKRMSQASILQDPNARINLEPQLPSHHQRRRGWGDRERMAAPPCTIHRPVTGRGWSSATQCQVCCGLSPP